MKFHLIERAVIPANEDIKPYKQVFWGMLGEKHGMKAIVNEAGGWCPFDKENCKILKVVEVEDYINLDYSMTTEYKKILKNSKDTTLECGWLSREGRAYYCEYHDHIDMLQLLLNTNESHLEKTGWVKFMHDKLYWIKRETGIRLSAEQRNWLSKNGYVIQEGD